MQTLKISLDFGVREFYCPFTGLNLMDAEQYEQALKGMVMAMSWDIPYDPLHGEEALCERFSALYLKDGDFRKNPTEVLEKFFAGENYINLEVTCGGMACRPVWSTTNYVYFH